MGKGGEAKSVSRSGEGVGVVGRAASGGDPLRSARRATLDRFLGNIDGKRVTTNWDHELGRPKGVTKPSPGQRPGDGMSIVASALKGRANRWAEWLGPFGAEMGFGVGISQGVALGWVWGRPLAFGHGSRTQGDRFLGRACCSAASPTSNNFEQLRDCGIGPLSRLLAGVGHVS